MENQEQQNQNKISEKQKSGYWRFVIGFLVIIGLVIGGYFVWNWHNRKDDIRKVKEATKAYEEYLDVYRKDFYGGKTPEETLNLFVEALKRGDIDLASKYFMPDDDGSGEKWEKALMVTREEGKLKEAADKIERAVFQEKIGDGIVTFITYNQNKDVEAFISLHFNGNVWKIKSL